MSNLLLSSSTCKAATGRSSAGRPRSRRRSVREYLVDLQKIAVRVVKFGYQYADLALAPVAGIFREFGLTDDLYAGQSAYECNDGSEYEGKGFPYRYAPFDTGVTGGYSATVLCCSRVQHDFAVRIRRA